MHLLRPGVLHIQIMRQLLKKCFVRIRSAAFFLGLAGWLVGVNSVFSATFPITIHNDTPCDVGSVTLGFWDQSCCNPGYTDVGSIAAGASVTVPGPSDLPSSSDTVVWMMGGTFANGCGFNEGAWLSYAPNVYVSAYSTCAGCTNVPVPPPPCTTNVVVVWHNNNVYETYYKVEGGSTITAYVLWSGMVPAGQYGRWAGTVPCDYVGTVDVLESDGGTEGFFWPVDYSAAYGPVGLGGTNVSPVTAGPPIGNNGTNQQSTVPVIYYSPTNYAAGTQPPILFSNATNTVTTVAQGDQAIYTMLSQMAVQDQSQLATLILQNTNLVGQLQNLGWTVDSLSNFLSSQTAALVGNTAGLSNGFGTLAGSLGGSLSNLDASLAGLGTNIEGMGSNFDSGMSNLNQQLTQMAISNLLAETLSNDEYQATNTSIDTNYVANIVSSATTANGQIASAEGTVFGVGGFPVAVPDPGGGSYVIPIVGTTMTISTGNIPMGILVDAQLVASFLICVYTFRKMVHCTAEYILGVFGQPQWGGIVGTTPIVGDAAHVSTAFAYLAIISSAIVLVPVVASTALYAFYGSSSFWSMNGAAGGFSALANAAGGVPWAILTTVFPLSALITCATTYFMYRYVLMFPVVTLSRTIIGYCIR
jgi:hypothetical protein